MSSTSVAPRPLVARSLSRWWRRSCAALLAAVLVVVGFIVLTPGRPAEASQQSLRDLIALWHAQGRLPMFITFELVEWSANVVMFVPIGLFAAGAVQYGRRRWVVPAAALLSIGVELAQKAFLPERVSSAADVLANTTGAALGAAIALVVIRLVGREPDPS